MDTFTTTATGFVIAIIDAWLNELMDCIVEDAGYGDAKQNEDVYRGLTADAYFASRTDHETLPNIGFIYNLLLPFQLFLIVNN